jgi:membrane protease YdiL (CAAX protease family)
MRGKQVAFTSKLAQVGELIGVFSPAIVAVLVFLPLVGDNPLARHGTIFTANVLMLVLVWVGLRLRGQSCMHFGLSFRRPSRQRIMRAVLQSFAVFAAAVAAMVVAAVVMGSIFGIPEGADMSGYDFLRGNLPLLLLVLVCVYFNASFGEEVIYRGFLITRIAELGSGGKAGWWAGVLISSLTFGVIHSDWALVGIVQMAFMGLALGVSYLLVRRNLWVTILAHGYADTILIVQMYFGEG